MALEDSDSLKQIWNQVLGFAFNLFEIGAYCCCLGTVAGFLSGLVPFFDLLSHFRVQFLIFLALFVVPVFAKKKLAALSVTLLAIVLNLYAIVPLYLAAPAVSGSGPSEELNIVDVNFNSRNLNFEKMDSVLKENNPDIVCWQEFSPAAESWTAKNISTQYPYSKRYPRNDNFGIAIFSKIPVDKFQEVSFADVPITSIIATVPFSGKTLDVICMHTYPPISLAALNTRDTQMKNVARFVQQSGHPSIVCGDLNATSWTSSFQELLKESGLKDSRVGFGVQPSWPTQIWLMQIPIDHVLVDPKIRVVSRTLGHDVESDHVPVIVKLQI